MHTVQYVVDPVREHELIKIKARSGSNGFPSFLGVLSLFENQFFGGTAHQVDVDLPLSLVSGMT